MRYACPFCRIALRRVPAEVVYEDDLLLAFLDIAPIRPGHMQIIDRRGAMGAAPQRRA